MKKTVGFTLGGIINILCYHIHAMFSNIPVDVLKIIRQYRDEINHLERYRECFSFFNKTYLSEIPCHTLYSIHNYHKTIVHRLRICKICGEPVLNECHYKMHHFKFFQGFKQYETYSLKKPTKKYIKYVKSSNPSNAPFECFDVNLSSSCY